MSKNKETAGFLREQAASFRSAANQMIEALQDYIADIEFEAGQLNHRASTYEEKARELENE